MKAAFAPLSLRCPFCRRDRTLTLTATQSDEREVREGVLRCGVCASEFPVHRGVGHLLHDPPAHVAREAAGLERFAEFMRNTGWDRERIRQLPHIEDGYWFVQTVGMRQLLETVGFTPGQSLLDVGSNTCWAANRFAVEGLAVTALDISTAELQGLYTADYFIEDGTSYFERVLGSMNEMPIASGALDYVYCCEVLHHNDSDGLRRTMEEAFRVLKPGGQLLVVNETLKTLHDPHGVHVDAVAHWEGYEHAHWAARYRGEAIRAGFHTRLLEPRYHGFFGDGPPGRALRPPRRNLRLLLRYGLRANRLTRLAYLNWLLQVRGGIAFAMIATKPERRRLLSAAARLRGPRRRAGRSG